MEESQDAGYCPESAGTMAVKTEARELTGLQKTRAVMENPGELPVTDSREGRP